MITNIFSTILVKSYLGALSADAVGREEDLDHRVGFHDEHEVLGDLRGLYLEINTACTADVSSEPNHDLLQVILQNCVG